MFTLRGSLRSFSPRVFVRHGVRTLVTHTWVLLSTTVTIVITIITISKEINRHVQPYNSVVMIINCCYTHTQTHTHTYIYIHTRCVRVFDLCMYVYIVCMHACIHNDSCLYIHCMSALYVCLHYCTYGYVCIHCIQYMYVCMNMYACMYACIYVVYR